MVFLLELKSPAKFNATMGGSLPVNTKESWRCYKMEQHLLYGGHCSQALTTDNYSFIYIPRALDYIWSTVNSIIIFLYLISRLQNDKPKIC